MGEIRGMDNKAIAKKISQMNMSFLTLKNNQKWQGRELLKQKHAHAFRVWLFGNSNNGR